MTKDQRPLLRLSFALRATECFGGQAKTKDQYKRGVTLVELLISIMIISIAFYTLISVFSFVATKSGDSQTITTANYLAQGKTEEWIAKGYSYVGTPPINPTTWTSFDSNVSTDILDYPGRFQNYGYKVAVAYIDQTQNPIVESSGTEGTTWKKVTVKVSKLAGGQYSQVTSMSFILAP